MKQYPENKFYCRLPVKTILVIITLVSLISASLAFRESEDRTNQGSR